MMIRATILDQWVKYQMFENGVFVYEVYLKMGDPYLDEMIRTYYEGFGFMGYCDDPFS
jgi:hypothetical protein